MTATTSATGHQLGGPSDVPDDHTLSLHAAGKSEPTRTLSRLADSISGGLHTTPSGQVEGFAAHAPFQASVISVDATPRV